MKKNRLLSKDEFMNTSALGICLFHDISVKYYMENICFSDNTKSYYQKYVDWHTKTFSKLGKALK